MSHFISAAHRSFLVDKSDIRFFATCWQITRTDGTVYRFTNHDNNLILTDGNTYTPVGGIDSSAIEKNSNLEIENLEFSGMIQSGAITFDDLRAGRFREAEVIENVVDWRFPWVGEFITNKYWITEISFTGENWIAKVEGVTRWLRPPVGNIYSRTCRYTLGDSQCTVNLPALAVAGAVSTIVGQRTQITSNVIGGGNDHYNFGKIVWSSGNNNGLVTEVKDYDSATGGFTFFINTPFDIQVGDAFTASPGCDKILSTCKDKFSNLIFFGGFPYVPGTKATLVTLS